jgi:hypothetical protein
MATTPVRATGYSGTPLIRKLGFTGAQPAVVMNPPCPYADLLAEPVDITVLSREMPVPGGCLFLHLFTTQRDEMQTVLAGARHRIAPAGMVWISWPKRSAKVATDITEDVIRAVCLPMGYVDIKVCAVDAVWSGLKLVIRKELR